MIANSIQETSVITLETLKIKLFVDGAQINDMLEMSQKSWISGFTTNPTLMKKAGVSHYEKFAKEVLEKVKTNSISFEVFSDDLSGMEEQALKIKTWGKNVFVKIPAQNTKGQSTAPLIKKLTSQNTQVNVTALLTEKQVQEIVPALNPKIPSIVSVFAGRVADTGIDPIPLMKNCAKMLENNPQAELLWASTREVFNIVQAQNCGCKIITVPADILKKLSILGTDLNTIALDTVKTFYEDGQKAGYSL